jgi:molybdopterin converting factor small subunit
VIIRNSVTSEIIKWYEERKPKWKIEFKPSDVENIIINHNNNKNEN